MNKSILRVALVCVSAAALLACGKNMAKQDADATGHKSFGWPGLYVGMTLDQARAVIEKQGYPADPKTPMIKQANNTQYFYDYVDSVAHITNTLLLSETVPGPGLMIGIPYVLGNADQAKAVFSAQSAKDEKIYGPPKHIADSDDAFCVSEQVDVRITAVNSIALTSVVEQPGGIPMCKGTKSKPTAMLFQVLPGKPEIPSSNLTQAASRSSTAAPSPASLPQHVQQGNVTSDEQTASKLLSADYEYSRSALYCAASAAALQKSPSANDFFRKKRTAHKAVSFWSRCTQSTSNFLTLEL